jgi:hypothetical protein
MFLLANEAEAFEEGLGGVPTRWSDGAYRGSPGQATRRHAGPIDISRKRGTPTPVDATPSSGSVQER